MDVSWTVDFFDLSKRIYSENPSSQAQKGKNWACFEKTDSEIGITSDGEAAGSAALASKPRPATARSIEVVNKASLMRIRCRSDSARFRQLSTTLIVKVWAISSQHRRNNYRGNENVFKWKKEIKIFVARSRDKNLA